jgi:hypothetical protein
VNSSALILFSISSKTTEKAIPAPEVKSVINIFALLKSVFVGCFDAINCIVWTAGAAALVVVASFMLQYTANISINKKVLPSFFLYTVFCSVRPGNAGKHRQKKPRSILAGFSFVMGGGSPPIILVFRPIRKKNVTSRLAFFARLVFAGFVDFEKFAVYVLRNPENRSAVLKERGELDCVAVEVVVNVHFFSVLRGPKASGFVMGGGRRSRPFF